MYNGSRMCRMDSHLARQTIWNMERSVVTFQTFHIVKQMLANGGGAGLGLGLCLELRSIFVFVLVVIFVLLGGPQKQCRHMLFGSCFQAPRGLPHIPTSTSAREETDHIRLLVGGENVLAAFWKHWLGGENDTGLAKRIRLVRGVTHLHLQHSLPVC